MKKNIGENEIKKILECEIISAQKNIEDIESNQNREQKIKSEKIDDIKKEIARLKETYIDVKKGSIKRAQNYAENYVYDLSRRDLEKEYGGSKNSAYNRIYEKKEEEYYFEDVYPVKNKLESKNDELNYEIKKEIEDNIKKETEKIISNAKENVRAELKKYGINSINFIDFEKLITTHKEIEKLDVYSDYINWLAKELDNDNIESMEQVNGDFVRRFNTLYSKNKEAALMVSDQDEFMKKYVENIDNIDDPDTMNFLYNINYRGKFSTEEMEKEFKQKCQSLNQKKEIQKLQSEVTKQENEIHELKNGKEKDKNVINENNKKIESQNVEIKEKDETIEKQKDEITSLNKDVNQKDEELQNKDMQINDLTIQVKSKEQNIKENESIIGEQKEQNEKLLEKIKELENEKKVQDNKIQSLELTVSKQANIIEKDSTIIDTLKNSISKLQDFIAMHDDILNILNIKIKDLFAKADKHHNNITKESQKGLFTKIKDKLFPSKNEDKIDIKDESSKILADCSSCQYIVDVNYKDMSKRTSDIERYQIKESVLDDRSKKIKEVNGKITPEESESKGKGIGFHIAR